MCTSDHHGVVVTGLSAFEALQLAGWLTTDIYNKRGYIYILTVKVFFLGSTDFMRGGFAHSLADSRAGHAVLSCCDPIRDRLSRHLSLLSLSVCLFYPQSAKIAQSTQRDFTVKWEVKTCTSLLCYLFPGKPVQ